MTAGNDATFQPAVEGSTLTYQWNFQDNTPGHGPQWAGDQRTLYLPGVQLANAGTYTLSLTTDQEATTNSSAAELTVVWPVAVAAPSGVAAWWRGEGSGNDVLGENPLSIDGTSNFVSGKVGQAFDFDGASTDLHLLPPTNWNSASWAGFTIEAWINPTSQNAPSVEPIFEQLPTSLGGPVTVALSASTPGSLDVLVNGGSSRLSSSPGVIRPGAFQHIALANNIASNQLCLYVNGQQVASAAALDLAVGSNDIYFGYSPSGSLSNPYYAGQMDEITIYSRALAPAEIQSIYNAGSAGKIPPCTACDTNAAVSWWQAESNGADVFAVNPAVIEGGVSFAPGEVGQAFTFDGSADVRVPASASLSVGGGSFTLEAWVNPNTLSSAQPLLEWNSGYVTGVALWIS
ncbi:MAG TPA: LamG domain-containing protein, partial [Dongiaceae bacterium]|nr:LamG domain-containing protein [Dongiaceae bacterium]